MSDAPLNPCPFCGSDPGGVDGPDTARAVGCYCGANGPIGKTDQSAIDAWNMRDNTRLDAEYRRGIADGKSAQAICEMRARDAFVENLKQKYPPTSVLVQRSDLIDCIRILANDLVDDATAAELFQVLKRLRSALKGGTA